MSNLNILPVRRQKGRNAPLPTFTFESTGETVQIKRLGPFTMDELRKALLKQRKPPEPPKIRVHVGEAQVPLDEVNAQDPDYIKASFEYNEWLHKSVTDKMLELMINYCIVCDIDEDVVQDQRMMLAMIDPEINETLSDREVYVRYYLMATPAELTAVQSFILGQSMPTQGAVQEHINTFPGEVQGEGPILTPGAPIRVPVQ